MHDQPEGKGGGEGWEEKKNGPTEGGRYRIVRYRGSEGERKITDGGGGGGGG